MRLGVKGATSMGGAEKRNPAGWLAISREGRVEQWQELRLGVGYPWV